MPEELSCSAEDCPYEGAPGNRRRRWHLDRSFSIQSLLQIIGGLIAIFAYLQTFDRRLTVLESANSAQLAKDRLQDQDMRELRSEIRDDLKEIRKMLEDRRR